MTSNFQTITSQKKLKSNTKNTYSTHEELYQAESWVFDLDNTLYSAQYQLFTQIENNMTQFVMGFLDLDHANAFATQKKYFRDHGTTMNGLMIHNGLDPAEYLEYVHKIDLSEIPKNPELDMILSKLPGKKVIFTNGSTKHAHNVTSHLGINHHFDGVFDIVDSDYTPKPARSVYETMIQQFDIDPKKSVMVEDMAKNLRPAADMGMTTVWVRTDSAWGIEEFDDAFIHHIADDLTDWLAKAVQ